MDRSKVALKDYERVEVLFACSQWPSMNLSCLLWRPDNSIASSPRVLDFDPKIQKLIPVNANLVIESFL